jgi:hypothetical protein
VKKTTRSIRASHVNAGTSVPKDELAWPQASGPVMRMPKLHAEVIEGAPVTPYGGLAWVEQFLRRFRLAEAINASVHVLRMYLPYMEADHVLAQAVNLYAGGTCLEDMSCIQHDEAVRRMFGACRFPDPTTAGDFLRRFDDQVDPGSLDGLRAAIDTIAYKVWKRLGRRHGQRMDGKRWAVVHLDGPIKELYGQQIVAPCAISPMSTSRSWVAIMPSAPLGSTRLSVGCRSAPVMRVSRPSTAPEATTAAAAEAPAGESVGRSNAGTQT